MGHHRIGAFVLAGVFGTLAAASCGNDAVGVDACRRVEDARCRRAPECGIALEPPFHTAGNDVDACIRFYDTACLHGLAAGNPGGSAVNDCVNSIAATSDCTSVRTPQNLAACSWLGPSTSSSVDAATPVDGVAADATGTADVMAATDSTATGDAAAAIDVSTNTTADATTE